MQKEKKKPTKDCYLGVKIHKSYMDRLETLQLKNGDDNKSTTARKILYAGLDKTR